jgi:hypothetical protein
LDRKSGKSRELERRRLHRLLFNDFTSEHFNGIERERPVCFGRDRTYI